MKEKLFVFIAVLFNLLIFTSCNKNDIIVQLKVSPDSLVIVDSDTLRELYLSTQPKGKMNFKITQKPEWLAVSPMNGTINGNIFSVKLIPVKDSLARGVYAGKISVEGDNGNIYNIPVIMSVNEHPKLKTNMLQISFAENVTETDFSIENSGTGILSWSIANTTSWLSISQSSGYLFSGQKSSLKLTCRRDNLDQNTYNSTLIINSNADIKILSVPVTMVVPKTSSMKLSSTNILFDYFRNNMDVWLKNTGNTKFNWSASNANYYTLTPGSGSLAKGDSIKINITLNRESLQTGILYSNIVITNSDNVNQTINAVINVFTNTKWMLDRKILDAEFCRNTNKIVIVSANPNRLSIIDPELKTIQDIPLNGIPNCVSINKNGDHAVVGHNGLISIVNLNTLTVEKEYFTSCNVLDILLTTSNWIYVFPYDQGTVRSINPTTGIENITPSIFNRAGASSRLAPSEKAIYSTNSGVYPGDVYKYSIENGVAEYLYDSSYHGNDNMIGNLWLSEEGDKIFTKTNTILTVDSNKANDMNLFNLLTWNPGNVNTETLFHSKAANKIFLITESFENQNDTYGCNVLVYNYTNLGLMKQYPLEKYLIPVGEAGGTICNAEGIFVFANNTGTKLYVIVQSYQKSGMLNDSAIQNIEVQ